MSSVASASSSPQLLARISHATRAWRWVLALLLLAVSLLALLPAPPRELSTGWDKLNHVLAFAALTFAARLSLPRRPWWSVALAMLAFGGMIELAQMAVPGRSCEWADIAADASGIAVGLLLVWPLYRRASAQR